MNRALKRWAVPAIFLAAGIGLACWPVTTRVGIDYRVSTYRIPLGQKAIQFVGRHLETRRLAREVTQGAVTDEEKILRIFSWVVGHVRATPPGSPVIDDHILNVVHRGYGQPDQQTEVFTLLASTAGYPAGMALLRAAPSEKVLPVALVQMGGELYLFDVANGLLFREGQGRLYTLAELQKNPSLIEAVTGEFQVSGLPYSRYLAEVPHLTFSPARMERQNPFSRLKTELFSS